MSPRVQLPLMLFLFVFAISLAAASDDEQLPPIPKRIPFTLTAYGSSFDEPTIEGTLKFQDGEARWNAPSAIEFSFARHLSLVVEYKSRRECCLDLSYERQGPRDNNRRFCFETRALDKDGRLLAHDWQMESDNRLGPKTIPFSGLTMTMSRINSPFNRLPREALANVAKFDIRFTEFPRGTPSHFPDGPHNLDLAITRSNRCGDFDVTFTNPPGWDLDPPKHQIAFQVFVYDAEKKLIRADRRFLMYRADGNYRQQVRVEPKFFDHSRVSISVYTRQPDNDKFIREFFYGGSSGYRGCWTGDGGELVELSIRGDKLFPDLPELAVLQAPARGSR